MQHEPIRDKAGNVVGYSRHNPMAAIRSLELLGKELGMFTGRPERQKALEHMTLEEMKQREAEINKRLQELDRLDEELDQQTKRKRLLKGKGTLH